jgi:hypothetical protein
MCSAITGCTPSPRRAALDRKLEHQCSDEYAQDGCCTLRLSRLRGRPPRSIERGGWGLSPRTPHSRWAPPPRPSPARAGEGEDQARSREVSAIWRFSAPVARCLLHAPRPIAPSPACGGGPGWGCLRDGSANASVASFPQSGGCAKAIMLTQPSPAPYCGTRRGDRRAAASPGWRGRGHQRHFGLLDRRKTVFGGEHAMVGRDRNLGHPVSMVPIAGRSRPLTTQIDAASLWVIDVSEDELR